RRGGGGRGGGGRQRRVAGGVVAMTGLQIVGQLRVGGEGRGGEPGGGGEASLPPAQLAHLQTLPVVGEAIRARQQAGQAFLQGGQPLGGGQLVDQAQGPRALGGAAR